MKYKIKFLFVILLVTVFLPKIAYGETYISGDIESDQIWVKESGPYYVSDIYIPPNVHVQVDAGTEIFASGYIAVFGSMNINGEENNKILMDLNPEQLFWSIHVGESAELVINNSVIRQIDGITVSHSNLYMTNTDLVDAFSGIVAVDQSEISVENIYVQGLMSGTALMAVSSSLNIRESIIEDSLGGNGYIVAGYAGSEVTVSGTEVVPTWGTPIIMIGGKLNILDSVLKGGESNGIELFPYSTSVANTGTEVTILNSKITDFLGDGILAIDPNIEINGSYINGNDVGIESYARDNFSITVQNSEIAGNLFGLIFGKQESDAIVNYDVRNNWWGDKSGPFVSGKNEEGLGDIIIGYGDAIDNIEFNSWLLSPIGSSECCSSVIFLPGLEASRLYSQEIFENQLWEPNRNADVKKLYLDSNGESLNQNIYTRDIIDRTNIGSAVGLPSIDKDIYRNFSLSMDSLVSDDVISEWKAFPYDWRFDFEDLIQNGINLENEISFVIPEIERLAEESKTGRVTIVTHSNGGLFAKFLIRELQDQDKEELIDKLIMVAAPQIGTPTALGALLHGEEQELGYGFLMNRETARGLGENMKSAYNLLPSQKYFENIFEPIVSFDPSIDTISNFRSKYGDSISSYSEMTDFILARKDLRTKPSASNILSPNVLNDSMIADADNLHQSLDNWIPGDNIRVVQIAGWGINTTKGYKYKAKNNCLPGTNNCVLSFDHEAIKTIDGDGTVLSPSAVVGEGEVYYVNIEDFNLDTESTIEHINILEMSHLEEFIKNIIQNNTEIPEYITEEKPRDLNNSNLKISMHSPVSIHAYDELGNHTGIIQNPDPDGVDFVENNIPNSSYEEIGEGKYIYISGVEDDPVIKLNGLGSGTFTLNISKSIDGEVQESSFSDIPTNPNMEGEVIISATSTSLLLDVEGDGKSDIKIKPNEDLDPISYLLIIKKTLDGFDIAPKVKANFIKRIDAIIKSIEKGKVKNAVKKVKDFNKKLKSLSKHKLKQHHHKKISKDDAEIFINMLNELLDLLEAK